MKINQADLYDTNSALYSLLANIGESIMVILICSFVILFILMKSADDDYQSAKDDYNEAVAERRHYELLQAQRRTQEIFEERQRLINEERRSIEVFERKRNKNKKKKTIRRIRTIAEDEFGNIIAQEVVEKEVEE